MGLHVLSHQNDDQSESRISIAGSHDEPHFGSAEVVRDVIIGIIILIKRAFRWFNSTIRIGSRFEYS
jgi:hypothetical protein